MTIKTKLLLSFTIINLLLALITGITYFQFKTVNTSYSDTIEERLHKIGLASDMIEDVYREQAAVRAYLVNGSETELNRFKELNTTFKTSSTKLFNESSPGTPGNQLTEEMIHLENQYREVAEQLILLKKQNKKEAYNKLMNEQESSLINSLHEVSEKLANYERNSLLKERDTLSAEVKDTQLTILIISILSIIIGVTIASLIGRNISKAVRLLTKTTRQIADGNLLIDSIEIKNKDELGLLATDVNKMAGNLRTIIQKVHRTSEQVAASAEELTANTEQTNSTTSQVTTSIDEVAKHTEILTANADQTAHTVNEMAMGVQRVADTTSTVTESALETTRQANIGNEHILKVIDQMKSIHSSSNKTNEVIKELSNRSNQIGQIIEVITGIAEQTNLLALNAAIESARAGEHGRGFTVVAEEVKKLAEQSRESANQIAELIQATQTDTAQVVEMMNTGIIEVTEGMRLVQETGESFNSILNSIENVSSEIEEVSAISEEMSAGVEQVNASVAEVATIIKTTAENTAKISEGSEEQLASMNEISEASAALAKMSEDLSDIVKQFKI